ncbi:hypothetical protein M405DRAFT_860107 [Rhizopogon salebrosus TDB-379]|nr:hypothetical protein M405DRAFT_860107 [Rhizopogon salebrosus TDB-379]
MGAKAVVGKVDEFTGMLWRGWKNVQEQGAVQVGLRPPSHFPWAVSQRTVQPSKAHDAYGIQGARILFVVHPNECSVFDQCWLEYVLVEKHGTHVISRMPIELAVFASLGLCTHALIITLPSASSLMSHP